MNRVFILGAGFSYYISGEQFPLMAQLGEEFKQIHSWASSYLPEGHEVKVNLERLLTRLDLELQEESNSILEERISDIKAFLKERLSLDKIEYFQKMRAITLCSKLFMEKDAIITFNYDCLLEHILWKLTFWSPNGGYGNSPGLNMLSGFGSEIERNPKDIIILKPHGSLNFEEISNNCDTYLQPWISDKLFPNIHSKWNRESEMPPVVLPSFVKMFGGNRTFIYIWHEAIEKIRKADIITAIGYSLPKSDTTARFLLSFLNADEFKARGINKLKVGILNKGSDAQAIKEQITALGRFGTDDVEFKVFDEADEDDYSELSSWCCRIQS